MHRLGRAYKHFDLGECHLSAALVCNVKIGWVCSLLLAVQKADEIATEKNRATKAALNAELR